MSDNRRLIAFFLALASVLIVIGSLYTALVQGGYFESQGEATPAPTTQLQPSSTPIPPSATATPAPTRTGTPCSIPEGWHPYTVDADDSLESLAVQSGLDAAELAAANCLTDPEVSAGMVLYFPAPVVSATPTSTESPTATSSATPTPTSTGSGTPSPTPFSTAISCGPPANWVRYTVRQGDTLFNLSQRLGVSIGQLQFANCLGSSTVIQIGQSLWVPFIPPPLTGTPTRTPSPTLTPSPTTTSAPPSQTPTPSNTPPVADTETPTPSLTPPPSETPPPTATHTPPATATEGSFSLPQTGTPAPNQTSPPYP